MEQNTIARGETASYHETYRPQFHFTAPAGWLNDPNGLVYHAGEYHLFFQHNPFGVNWGNMTWGHAVSGDLVHWRALPNAIEPDRMGTIFSGSAVVDNGNTAGFQTGREPALVAIYTAAGGSSPESDGQPFTQCIASSNDRGLTWSKYERNPVLPHIVGENRDPKVIWYAPGRFWVMALFLDGESFALFTSPDLKHWTRTQTLAITGSECPDFFPLSVEGEPDEERWVFMAANGHYIVGTFDGARFVPETDACVLDFGANYYAMQTYSDIPAQDGRRIQIAWMAGGA
jgi:sucrose-6-phosphate hydrolase SacC (GH32 family)